MVKDILLFQSDAFSLEPPRNERGVQYDLPLGDDIGEYLKKCMTEKSVAWNVVGPVREDFGALLLLDRDSDALCITTSWQGGDAWALVFTERRGCLGWLLGWQPNKKTLEALREVKLLVDEVVHSDSVRFRNPVWIDDHEFPGVAQNFMIPD